MADTTQSAMSGESWESARGYSGVFGDMPSSFSVVVRSMMADHSSGQTELSAGSRYGIGRLLKSQSLFTPIYFAAKIIEDPVTTGSAPPSPTELAKAFSAFDLAYLTGLIYFFKRAQSLCEPEEFKCISDDIAEASALALLLGRAIPSIGVGTALMEATAPQLGLACILKHDVKGFKEYRRLVKRDGKGWNADRELEQWGCTRLQIGSIVVQLLGFGIQRANALLAGLTLPGGIGPNNNDSLSRDVFMAHLWRTATQETGKAPSIALPAKYYPSGAAYSQVVSRFTTLRFDPGQCDWLSADKDELLAVEGGDQEAPKQ